MHAPVSNQRSERGEQRLNPQHRRLCRRVHATAQGELVSRVEVPVAVSGPVVLHDTEHPAPPLPHTRLEGHHEVFTRADSTRVKSLEQSQRTNYDALADRAAITDDVRP